jgi:hypothetical protein
MVPPMVRRCLLPVLAIAVMVTAIPAAAHASQRIRGAGFRSAAPSGWHIDRKHGGGWHGVEVASPGTVGRRLPDSARVTVNWISAKTLARKVRKRVPSDPSKLQQMLFGLPAGVVTAKVITKPTVTTFAGTRAGLQVVRYPFRGTDLVETDLAFQRHHRVYLVQSLADSGMSSIASSALNTIRGRWRWS